ncbi:MAG: class III signal peptide-containing protein [Methanobacterium sp.]
MDRRGQISLEFVLILALMAVIVGAIGWYAGNANEQNVITSAVRSAADNATTTLAMLNRSMKPVRVEDIATITNGTKITLQIDISGSPSANQTQTITSSILSSVAAQGYNVTSNTIVTNKHVYTIKVV